jgi:hypothetical protein
MRILRSIIPLSLGVALIGLHPSPASAQIGVGIGIGVSVHVAPPPLPIYVQPPIPAPGYIWTPGYWAWGDNDYYWVPGTWVQPPSIGVLWTPPYWGWADGAYGFHAGYWGPHVGFYGGINYGFGYGGIGFEGGFWEGGHFSYNSAVNNFGNVHIGNTYNKTIINNNLRTSFNGGQGGIEARPTPEQEAAEHEQHIQPTQEQLQHRETAMKNPELRASANHGNPAIAATSRPGEFSGKGVVPAKTLEEARHNETAADNKANHEAAEAHHESREAGHQETRANTATDQSHHEENVAQHDNARAHNQGERANTDQAKLHQAHASHPAPQHPAAEHPRPAPRPQAAPHPQARPAPEHHEERK